MHAKFVASSDFMEECCVFASTDNINTGKPQFPTTKSLEISHCKCTGIWNKSFNISQCL